MGLAKQLGLKFILQSNNIHVIGTMIEGGNSATAAAAIFFDGTKLATGFGSISYEDCVREKIEP